MSRRIYILIVSMAALMLASCAGGAVSERERAYDRAHAITTGAFNDYWDHDLEKVIEVTTEAIAVDPEYAWPYSLRGAAKSALGRYDEAMKDLDKSLELSPAFTPAYVNRAILKIRTGRHAEAKADLALAIAHVPDNLTAIVYMAEALAMEGDIKQACRYVEKAITLGFNDLEVLEKRPGFQGLRLSECYSDVMRDVYDMSAP